MPLLFVALAAMLFGLYKLYVAMAGAWGAAPGTAAVIAVVALAAGCALLLLKRHRALHGRRINGKRVLQVGGDWGRLVVNAEARHAHLRLAEQGVDFIFGDIAHVARTADTEPPAVILRLRTAQPREWRIPMRNERQARRWTKILTLAEQRTL